MDRNTVRGIAFWTTVVTSLLTLLVSSVYAVIPFIQATMDLEITYRALSVFSLFVHVINTCALMLFLGLVHYDLTTAKRLSEHARDYLIRDMTQSSESGNSTSTSS